MPPIALYDANVLYPSGLRDVLIRIAVLGVVRARWTEDILDEVFGNLMKNRPDLDPAKLARTRALMCKAVPNSVVRGHQGLLPALRLPDPGDCHVVRAAVRCGADVIVTANTTDFPEGALQGFGLKAKHPDDFLQDLLDVDDARVRQAVEQAAAARRKPPVTLDQFADSLERDGLAQTAALLRGRPAAESS